MVSKVKSAAELELMGAVLQGGSGEGGGIAEVPGIGSEVLIAAAIADEARERVVDLQIETLHAPERGADARLVLTLHSTIDRAAHGIVHVHASHGWIDSAESG